MADSVTHSLNWFVKPRAEVTLVEFRGEVDESADFTELQEKLEGTVVFDLGKIKRLNSFGVRAWVNFVTRLRNVKQISYIRCSSAVMTQLNMVPKFRAEAKVESFYAPYICDPCNISSEKLLTVATDFAPGLKDVAPNFRCTHCGEDMDFDAVPEIYFCFMTE